MLPDPLDVPLAPVLPLAPVALSGGVLPGVPGEAPMPLVLLLVPALVVVSGLVLELELVELGDVVVGAGGGRAVVVSSFLLQAAADKASAIPIGIKMLLRIVRSFDR